MAFEKEKEKFSRDWRAFKEGCKFVQNPRPLAQEVKDIMILFEGAPLQDLFYNTIIYNMPDTDYDTVVKTAAELYYYQGKLNKRIGRTFYDRAIDETLMKCIYEEIVQRFPKVEELEIARRLVDETKELDSGFKKDVYKHYVDNYKSENKRVSSAAELMDCIKEYGRKNEGASVKELIDFINHNQYAEDEEPMEEIEFTDYFRKCLERNKENQGYNRISAIDCENQFRTQLGFYPAKWYGKVPPKEKDDLYILCIALGLNIDDFNILRRAAGRHWRDSTIFADNTYSDRDNRIQSVIKTIDKWYEVVRKDNKNPPIECMPKRVLEAVNDMLAREKLEILDRHKSGNRKN